MIAFYLFKSCFPSYAMFLNAYVVWYRYFHQLRDLPLPQTITVPHTSAVPRTYFVSYKLHVLFYSDDDAACPLHPLPLSFPPQALV